MRSLFIAVSLLLSLSTSSFAGPADEALQVAQRWTKAFTEADVEGILGLYEPDALFMGTLSKAVVAAGFLFCGMMLLTPVSFPSDNINHGDVAAYCA